MDNVIDIKDKAKPPKAASAGGSGGGWDINLETRVGNLEAKVDKIDGRLGNIERILFEIQSDLKHKASTADVARIEGKLDTKASATELAEVKGKLSQVPNTWQFTLGLMGFAGLIFAVVKFIK